MGASAGAVGLLYPGAERALGFGATAEAPVREGTQMITVNGPDPTYAGGVVVAQTSTGVVLEEGDITRGVRIPPTTVVWKETELGPEVIQQGDRLDVKGVPQSDGTLLANSGWVFVNIGRRDGTVMTSDGTSATLSHQGETFSIEFSDVLEVISAEDSSPLSGGRSAIEPGAQIGAVGLNLPGGGFRATRIWL